MKYCASSFGELSNSDIHGARNVYGRKPAGSIVGLGGRCLNISGGTLNNGNNPLINWDCTGGTNDTWTLTSGGQLRATMAGPIDRCANVQGGATSTTSGTALTSWPCTADDNEVFYFKSIKWMVAGNICVRTTSKTLGNTLSIGGTYDCSDDKSDWDFLPDGRIQLANTNLCAANNLVNDYYRLQLANCSMAPNQYFSRNSDGTLRQNTQYISPACVEIDVNGGSMMGMNGCLAGPPTRQQFYLSGSIHGRPLGLNASQCLDVYGGYYDNGTSVQEYPCTNNGSPNQTWQYYFK
ncbi:MAG: hypothetical protein EOO70_08760 [Myxococcaceae bacterium]|nr:MAG: hypothetical protein EOO70_08760 [Myxococcaceae bacterium]